MDLSLKIRGQWAVLEEGTEISIEMQSPLWEEGSSFSYSFTLDVEQNLHILGTSAQTDGASIYDVLHREPAELYLLGIPFFRGVISLDEETEISEGKVEVSLISSNLSFDDLIADMNCQDVEITDRIVVGERWKNYTTKVYHDGVPYDTGPSGNFPMSLMRMVDDGVSTVNVSEEYPKRAYCNTRIAYPVPEDAETVSKADGVPVKLEYAKEHTKGSYIMLEAERPNSGLCFYVLYFLDLLFKQIGVAMDMSMLESAEDFKRLAFFSTRCEYDMDEEPCDKFSSTNVSGNYYYRDFSSKHEYPFMVIKATNGSKTFSPIHVSVYVHKCIANSKNFPDTSVSEVIEAIESGFGVRMIFDAESRSGRMVFLKDVLNDAEVIDLGGVTVTESHKMENHIQGFRLSYQGGGEDDTSYSYDEWKRIVTDEKYEDIINEVALYNNKLYIDPETANAYRVKISKDATSEDEANPSLFEVAAFNAAEYGDCSDSERVESVEIKFTPIEMNDMNSVGYYKSVLTSGKTTPSQLLAKYVDATMQYPSCVPWIKSSSLVQYGNRQNAYVEIAYTYYTLQRFDDTVTDQSLKALKEKNHNGARLFSITPMNYETENPIFTASPSELTLGIMRGPGNSSEVVDYEEDYDGNGNFKYTTVAGDYAFTADTIDNFGNQYDYNGTEEGGVEEDGRFSLKLRSEKVTDKGVEYTPSLPYAKRRGLFDKFYREYAHFVTHRRMVKMTCLMEVADIIALRWEKRYRIGRYVGYIDKVSFTVGDNGMGEVSIDMWTV
ncbi:MAG: hypothetical protein ACI36Z_10770 [Alloprevotella sp.]